MNKQAALFYIPRKIWKMCEGGLMASFGNIEYACLRFIIGDEDRHGCQEDCHPERRLGDGERRIHEGGYSKEIFSLLQEYFAS